MMGGLDYSYKHTRDYALGGPWGVINRINMVRHGDRLPPLETHYNIFIQVQPHNSSLGVTRYMTDNCPLL
jgi:hypothetical protein